MSIELQVTDVVPPVKFGMGSESKKTTKGFTPPDFNQIISHRKNGAEYPAVIETPDRAFSIFTDFLKGRKQKNESALINTQDREKTLHQIMRSRLLLADAYCGSLREHCPNEETYEIAATRIYCLATVLAMVDEEVSRNRRAVDQVRDTDLLVRYGLSNPESLEEVFEAASAIIPNTTDYNNKFGYIVFGIKAEICTAGIIKKIEVGDCSYRMIKSPPSTDLEGVDYVVYEGAGVSEKTFFAVDVKAAFGTSVEGVATLYVQKGKSPIIMQNGVPQPYLDEAFDIPKSTVEFARNKRVPIIIIRVPAGLVNVPVTDLAKSDNLEYNEFLQKLQLEVSRIQKKGRSFG